MCEVMFGVKYNSQTHETYRFVPQAIQESNVRMGVLFHAPVLKSIKLLRHILPLAMQGRNRLIEFITLLLRHRSSLPNDGSVFSFLEAATDPGTGHTLTRSQIRGECAALLPAAFDTVSTTLCATLFYLSTNTSPYQKVREEILGKFGCADSIKLGRLLNSCVYLRACIDEALRMSPPAGGALLREVGQGGLVVDSLHIPEGVDVGVPIYALHHNNKYHSDPFCYRPERWLAGNGYATQSQVDIAKSAFMPFSRGVRSCLGKGFAYQEMMLALAHIIYRFDFFHADDISCPSWSRARTSWGPQFILQNHTTGTKHGPFLRFRYRVNENK